MKGIGLSKMKILLEQIGSGKYQAVKNVSTKSNCDVTTTLMTSLRNVENSRICICTGHSAGCASCEGSYN